ncbi:hypothetical protein RRF56_03005 [Nodosilinea sp. E11]|nr:hypothetical protein [Nodosilinea sp. E11]WOD39763.1 hypothetical protein RRF56_03005 [Nodosilinea sp. E11]
MRVLLVEDEEGLGLAIKQVLVGEKYVIAWVTDGAQAWYWLECRLSAQASLQQCYRSR